MTPDEMVNEIFRIQTERNPDEDPGDINIDIQDDSALTVVMQRKNGSILPYLGVGGSIQGALANALENVRGADA